MYMYKVSISAKTYAYALQWPVSDRSRFATKNVASQFV